MPNSIDKRIVEMQFDNARFEQNMNQSISTLDKLRKALNLEDAAKGFDELEKQAGRIDFSGLEKSISNIEYRFSALGIAGATVITTLTNKAISAVGKINSAVFGKIKSGGISRALNLEHANFMMEGLLKDSSKVAQIMSTNGPVQSAVRGTAYGLDAAANAAAQFIASGVTDMDKLQNALTGISGVAAMTGASYEDMASIFTTVAGQGKVMTMQLRQIEARGLNAAAALAEHLNTSEAAVRDMVTKGKIGFETFAEAMNKAFGDQAKKANETFTGAMSNVKAALSRIGAKVATPAIEEVRRVLVDLIGVIDGISKALDPVIADINNTISSIGYLTRSLLENKELVGVYTNAIDLFRVTITQVASFMATVADAFKDIFPSASLKQISDTINVLTRFVSTFLITGETADNLKHIFKGVFSVFDILGQAIGAVLRVLIYYSDHIGGFINGFLEAAAVVGDFFTGLSMWIRENDIFAAAILKFLGIVSNLKTFTINSLQEIRTFLAPFLSYIGNGIASLISSVESLEGSVNIIDKIKERFKGLTSIGQVFSSVFEEFKGIFSGVGNLLKNFAGYLGNGFITLFKGIAELVHSGKGFNGIIDLMNTLIGSSLALSIEKLISSFSQITSRGSTLVGDISFMFKHLASSLQVFQAKVKADMLASIAKSVGILTLSLIGLSLIDSDKLTKAFGAVSALMAVLVVARIALERFIPVASAGGSVFEQLITPFRNWFGMAAQANLLVQLATAIGILAGSLFVISLIKEDRLYAALGSLVVIIAGLGVAMAAFAKFSDKFALNGIPVILSLGVAMGIMAKGLSKLAKAKPESIIASAIAFGGVIFSIGAALQFIDGKEKKLMEVSGAISLIAVAIGMLAPGLALLSKMDPMGLAVGVVALGTMLAAISAALTYVKGDDLLQTAGAISAIAISIGLMAPGLALLSAMDPVGVAVGVAALGSMLGAIAAALMIVDGDSVQRSAEAMSIMALALGFLAPGLALLSAMDPVGVAVGVVALASMLGAMAAALMIVDGPKVIETSVAFVIMAKSLGMLVPSLVALSLVPFSKLISGAVGLAAAFTVFIAAAAVVSKFKLGDELISIGAGLALIGGSVALVGLGLSLLSAALVTIGVSGTSAAAGITTFMLAIGAALPNLLTGLAAGLTAFIIALGAAAASIGVALGTIIAGIIDGLRLAVKPLIDLIKELGLGLIEILKEWGGPLCDAVITIVDDLLVALDNHTESIISHLVSWIITLTEALATALNEQGPLLEQALYDLALSLISFLGANLLPMLLKLAMDIITMLINGFHAAIGELLKFLVDLGGEMLKALGVDKDWVDAGVNLVKGFIDGIVKSATDAVNAGAQMAKDAFDAICSVFKIHSPSKAMEWVGEMVDKGAANGITNNANLPKEAMEGLGDSVIGALDSKLGDAEIVAGEHADKIGKIIDEINKKLYGLTVAQQKAARAEDQKRFDMMGYGSIDALTRAGQAGLVTVAHQTKPSDDSTDATKNETAATGANTKAVKGNTAAKQENKKANDAKTKAIDEETESLSEEEQAAEDNSEAIRKMADEIEVVTERYHEWIGVAGKTDAFKTAASLQKQLGKFWGKALSAEKPSISYINKVFKPLNKNIKMVSNTLKKGVYQFDKSGKYISKVSKKVETNNKSIENYAKSSGNIVIKVTEGQATAFENLGYAIDKTSTRLVKNVKKLATFRNEAKAFTNWFNSQNESSLVLGHKDINEVNSTLRQIEKYYTTLGSMPQKVQDYLGAIRWKMGDDLAISMNTLGKSIDGISSGWNKSSQTLAYTTDAFMNLAAALYDGSEAANEYATEHERLIFLAENGEATWEEVEEHQRSYIQRLIDTLQEYHATLDSTFRGGIDVFSEFNKNFLPEGTDLLKNIESQIAGFTQFGDMIMELSKRGLSFGILKQLADEGISSYGKLYELTKMTRGELALFNQYYKESEAAIAHARDMSLAAVANATTQAAQRAAAVSGKMTKAQLKQSKKAAKALISDAKAVADNQVRYRVLTIKEEEHYLKNLTEEAKAAYHEQVKASKKAYAEEEKLARKEQQRRKEEAKDKSIIDRIKNFKTLNKVLVKYADNTKLIKKLNKELSDTYKVMNKNITKVTNVKMKDLKNGLLKFAETLESTGNESNNYFQEMRERLQKYIDGVKEATKANVDLYKSYSNIEKTSAATILRNVTSQVNNSKNLNKDLQKIMTMGFSNDVLKPLLDDIQNGSIEAAAQMARDLVSMTSGQVALLNSKTKTYNKQNKALAENTLNLIANQQAVSNSSRKYEKYITTAKKQEKELKEINKKTFVDNTNAIADNRRMIIESESEISAIEEKLAYARSSNNKRQIEQESKALKEAKDRRLELEKKYAKLVSDNGKDLLAEQIEQTKRETKIAQDRVSVLEKITNRTASQAAELSDLYTTISNNQKKLASLETDRAYRDGLAEKAAKNRAKAEAEEKKIYADSSLEQAKAYTEEKKILAEDAELKKNQAISALNDLETQRMNNEVAKSVIDNRIIILESKKKLTKAEEKELKSLKGQSKEYKKLIKSQGEAIEKQKEVAKSAKANSKAAASVYADAKKLQDGVEEQQKLEAAEAKRILTIYESITSYKALSKAMKQYAEDGAVMKIIAEDTDRILKASGGTLKAIGTYANYGILPALKKLPTSFKDLTAAEEGILKIGAASVESAENVEDFMNQAISNAADYVKSIEDAVSASVSFFELFDKSHFTNLENPFDYLAASASQTQKTNTFWQSLLKLANMGLDHNLLEQFANDINGSFDKVVAIASEGSLDMIGALNYNYDQLAKATEDAKGNVLAVLASSASETYEALRESSIKAYNDNKRKYEIHSILEKIISVDALKDLMAKYAKTPDVMNAINSKITNVLSKFSSTVNYYNKTNAFRSFDEYAKKANSSINIVQNGMLNFAKTLTDVAEDSDSFWESMTNGLSEYKSSLGDAIKQSSDFFAEFKGYSDEDNPLSATKYLENADSQIKAITEWSTALENLSGKLDEGIIKSFADKGLGSYEQVMAWSQATERQIGEYNDQWRRYNELLDKTTESAFTSVIASYSDIGQQMQDAMINAFKKNGAERIAAEMAEDIEQSTVLLVDGVKNGLGQLMPTLQAELESEGITKTIAQSIANAVDANHVATALKRPIMVATEQTTSEMISNFKKAVDSISDYISSKISDGFTIDVKVDTSGFDAAVARMNKAISSANTSAITTNNIIVISQGNANAANGENATTTSSSNINLYYTQNNNSPKALDRVEIYRQTQNQLATINGALNSAIASG